MASFEYKEMLTVDEDDVSVFPIFIFPHYQSPFMRRCRLAAGYDRREEIPEQDFLSYLDPPEGLHLSQPLWREECAALAARLEEVYAMDAKGFQDDHVDGVILTTIECLQGYAKHH